MRYADPGEAIRSGFEPARPPRRLSVSAANEAYHYVHNPTGYSGPYRVDVTPYLREPMDLLESPEFDAEIFVGPAQSGKTAGLVLGWLVHNVKAQPADMLIVEKNQIDARDFSMRRVERLHRYSPEIAECLGGTKHDNNLRDKTYRAGNLVTITHPSINELSGRPIPHIALTDYDRMPEDIDGEGAAFELGRKRTQTFGSRAMTLAESSPGREWIEPKWEPKRDAPHEAPPSSGILALYNRGDRRRWYIPCAHCERRFELSWYRIIFEGEEPREAAESAAILCPECGTLNDATLRDELNAAGQWVAEGQRFRYGARGARLIGTPRDTSIASFWLQGPAAAFITIPDLVYKYVDARRQFLSTGEATSLKTVTHQDLALPYKHPASGGDRMPSDLEDRLEPMGERIVPEGARFLITAIDVQKDRFVKQTYAFGVDLEWWLIDRRTLTESPRGEDDKLDPSAYAEDWALLDDLLEESLPLEGDPDSTMRVKLVVVDTGGADGVTDRAYRWFRKHRRRRRSGRIMLLKGAAAGQRLRKTYPEARPDRRGGKPSGATLYVVNVNEIKDDVDAMLDREQPGPNFLHLPKWLPREALEELTAETRTPKGWTNPTKAPNECWDLTVYARAGAIKLAATRINWKRPPRWALPWDRNSLVARRGERPAPEPEEKAPEKPQTKPTAIDRARRARNRRKRGGFVNRW